MPPEADDIDPVRALNAEGIDPPQFGIRGSRHQFVLPRRVRRQRTRGPSFFATAWRHLQWSASRPAGRRTGSRGDDLRPRARAKHAGTPFGVRHRRVLWTIATILVIGGALLVLSRSLPLLFAGGCLALAGLLVGTSLLWGRPFRSLHAETDHGRGRRLRLRGMLEAAAAGLEHVAQADPSLDSRWIADQFAARGEAAHRLLEAALGPAVADVYAQTTGNEPQAGVAGWQTEAAAKAFYVRYLIAYLDRLSIMGDWRP